MNNPHDSSNPRADRSGRSFESSHDGRVIDAHALLARLTRLAIIGEFDARHRLGQVLADALRIVKVDRVVVWRMTADGQSLVREKAASSPGGDLRTLPHELRASGAAHYFRALLDGEVLAASSEQIDPPLADAFPRYAQVHGVGAKLDIPLIALGRTIGLISFERLGRAAPWSTDDVTLALSVANLVQLGDWEARRPADDLLDSYGAGTEAVLPSLRTYRPL